MPKVLSGLLFGVLACVLAFGQGHAYSVKKWPLERQVSQADLVIIGYVEKTGIRDSNPKYAIELAEIKILSILKGVTSDNIKVVIRGAISEDNSPQCCFVGRQYVFVLNRRSDGVFYIVNGPFGVYEISSPSSGEFSNDAYFSGR